MPVDECCMGLPTQFDRLTANGIVRLTANGVNKLTVNGGYVTDCTGLRKIKNTRVS